MADTTKTSPIGIVDNVILKINKFLFPADFVVIDMANMQDLILGSPFLATEHTK